MANLKTRVGWETARQRGARAARKGLLPSDNPYKRSESGNYSWWESGWWEGENQMAVEQDRAVRHIGDSITLIGDNIKRQKQFEKEEESGSSTHTPQS